MISSEPPHPDSYGRVTNSERYSVLHDETRSIIASLVATYDVIAEVGNVEMDFPDWRGSFGEVVRLTPTGGVPLAFLLPTFPEF